MSPETFPGYLNYVYYSTVKKVSKREQRDTSIKKKNLFRNNTQLKSPATFTSYPEEYKAALTPDSKKYHSPTASSHFNTDYACDVQSVCSSLLEYICSRKITNY